MNQDIEKLLEKYYEGETSVAEERELKAFFQSDAVPEYLKSHAAQFNYYTEVRSDVPSLMFSNQLAAHLDPPQKGPVRKFTSWIVRIAAGLALLIVGFTGGWLLQGRFGGESAVSDASTSAKTSANAMKKVLAFEQMNVTSASERILAVNQSYDMDQVDNGITQLLINTLNFDPNVNVRLAACQALLHFQSEPGVSEALIQSLTIQTDPNVQISLIESLVSIKEKRAENQLIQLANNREVLDVVRLKAEEGISRLRVDA